MIEIRHLTKKYGENIAVNDLNLILESGNIYGFLGPNGAGKSTTMNIITGYIGATSGEVIINGHDINKEPEKAKQCIGYLPELPPVYGDMKVLEYMKFAAELKQLDKNTRTADIMQAMDLTKLHSVKNRLIRNLSKGYRQRVGLAQALLGMPEIIILDEPTVGLDPKQIIEIRDLIRSLGKKHTVILSSHILQEISAVCDHVFIISKGELVASDTMENLEEQMSGAQELNLTVRGTEKQVKGLSGLNGVKSCLILEVRDLAAENFQGEEEPAGESRSSAEDEKNKETKGFGKNLRLEKEVVLNEKEEAEHIEIPENEVPEDEEDFSERKITEPENSPEEKTEKPEDFSERKTEEPENSSEEKAEKPEDFSERKTEESENSSEEKAEKPEDFSERKTEESENSPEEKTEKPEDFSERKTEEPENSPEEKAEKPEDFSERKTEEPENFLEEESEGTVISEQKEMRLSLTAKSGIDIRESVFYYCAGNNLVLLEMKNVMKSLEDVFLELTDGKEVQ